MSQGAGGAARQPVRVQETAASAGVRLGVKRGAAGVGRATGSDRPALSRASS